MLVDFKNTLNINKKAYANETCEIKAINTENIKYIDEAAFYKANIKSLKNLPELCKIGKEAFSFSQIKNFDFKNVQTIGQDAFVRTCLKDVNIPKLETIGQSAFFGSSITSFTAPLLESIKSYTFDECTNLKHIEIPVCKNIDTFAFACCASLRKIVLPKTLKNVGNGIFFNCEKLEKVTFLSDVIIPPDTFMSCPGLKKIHVSENFIKLNKHIADFYKDKIVVDSLDDIIITNAKSFKEINNVYKERNKDISK